MITICEGSSIAFESSGEKGMISLADSLARFNNGDVSAAVELLLWTLIDAQVKQTKLINDSVIKAQNQAPDFSAVMAQVTSNMPQLMKVFEAIQKGNGAPGSQVATYHTGDPAT